MGKGYLHMCVRVCLNRCKVPQFKGEGVYTSLCVNLVVNGVHVFTLWMCILSKVHIPVMTDLLALNRLQISIFWSE